jgi:hypothetical protein
VSTKIVDLKSYIEQRTISIPIAGCWLWTLSVGEWGYARLGKNKFGNERLLHRLAYLHYVGPIPDGLCVLHKCDVPSCVNPHHLFLGTITDNNQDRARKKRSAPTHGEFNATAKLTTQQVRAIRSDPRRHCDVAKDYGVTPENICAIRKRQTWTHI